MRSTTLRWQKVLVPLGFVLVGFGGLILLGYRSVTPGATYTFRIVTSIGYCVLAWASWSWLQTLSRRRDGSLGMRRVLRLFAVACFLLGVAYVGSLNGGIDLYRLPGGIGARGVMASDALSLLGFVLAAVGFWTAGSIVEPRVSSQTGEAEAFEREATGHR